MVKTVFISINADPPPPNFLIVMVLSVVNLYCVVLCFAVNSPDVAVSSLEVVSCCVAVSNKGDMVPRVVTFIPVIVPVFGIESVNIIATDSVIVPEVNIGSYQEKQLNMNR